MYTVGLKMTKSRKDTTKFLKRSKEKSKQMSNNYITLIYNQVVSLQGKAKSKSITKQCNFTALHLITSAIVLEKNDPMATSSEALDSI